MIKTQVKIVEDDKNKNSDYLGGSGRWEVRKVDGVDWLGWGMEKLSQKT